MYPTKKKYYPKYIARDGIIYRRYRQGSDVYVESHKQGYFDEHPDYVEVEYKVKKTDTDGFFNEIESDYRLLHKPFIPPIQ